MGTPITSYELQRRLDIAKKREAAREAKKLATAPKDYKAEEIGGTGYFRSIEDENLWVEMPIPAKAGSAILADAGAAMGGLTLAEVTALTNAVDVKFKGNHKSVLRVRFTRLKATPTVKLTAWGTRVVDHTDDSFTVPFSAPANGSIPDTKALFNTFVNTGGVGATSLGTRAGNRADLIYDGRIIATKKVSA